MNKGMKKEGWYQKIWRPSTAIIYLVVVVFDFMVMPIYVETVNNKSGLNFIAFTEIAKFDEPLVQAELVKKINVGDRVWSPLTLQGGGLFHLAFGSILTGAAVTRGLQKRDQARYGGYYGGGYGGYDSGYGGGYDDFGPGGNDNYGGGYDSGYSSRFGGKDEPLP